jgi:transcription antitermination factor NusG
MTSTISPIPAPNHWYAVQTRPGAEKMSAAILAHKGYEVFCPVRDRQTSRCKAEVPLFPSYMFCRASGHSQGLIVTTPGVIRLLGQAGRPEPVPDYEVESVRRMLAVACPALHDMACTVGDLVRVERGPLRGVLGRVVGEAPDLRLVVSVRVLQRCISVTLDSSWLAPVDGAGIASVMGVRN